MNKKRSLIFVFLFAFLFSMSFISAIDTCLITTYPTGCGEGNTVMGLYGNTNTHGANSSSASGIEYVLCCNFVGTRTCTGTNKVLGLHSVSNAHAEEPGLTDAATDVCFGNLECIGTQTPSTYIGTYPIEMASLSSNANAHIGAYADFPEKILCANNGSVIIDAPIGYWAGYDSITTEIFEINISESELGSTANVANTVRVIVNNLQQDPGTAVTIQIFEKDEGTGINDDFIANIQTTILAGGVVNLAWIPTPEDIAKSEPEPNYEFYFKTIIGGEVVPYRHKILRLGVIWDIVPGSNSECAWLNYDNSTLIERIIIPIEYLDGSGGVKAGMSAPLLDDSGIYWRMYYDNLVHTLVTDLIGSSGAHVYSQVFEGDSAIPIRTGNNALVGVLSSTRNATAPWVLTLADFAHASKDIYEFKFYATKGGGINLDIPNCLTKQLFIKIIGDVPANLIGSWLNFDGQEISAISFDAGNLGVPASSLNTVQMNVSGFDYVPTDPSKVTLSIYEKNTGTEDDLIRNNINGVINSNGNVLIPWTVEVADIYAAGSNDGPIYNFYFNVSYNDVVMPSSPENNLAITITGTLPPLDDMFTDTVGIWMNDQGTAPKNYHPYQVAAQNVVSVYLTTINAPEGTPIQIEIYENDIWPFRDKIRTIDGGNPMPATVNSNGAAFILWTMSADDLSAAGNGGTAGDPWEFYFNVVALSGEEKSFSNEILEVVNTEGEVGGGDCINILSCSDLLTAALCETCNVDIEIIDPETGENICEQTDVTCSCGWDDVDGCGPYWSASGNPGGGGEVILGSCSTEEDFNGETCNNNDFLTYSWTSIWTWGAENPDYPTQGDCEAANSLGDCDEKPTGEWHYDPQNRNDICIDGQKTIACPAQVQLPFGNWVNWVFAIIIILVIYYLIHVSKVGKANKKKKVKKRKK